MANYNRPGVVTENQKNVVLAWWKKVTAANPKAENFQRLRVPVVDKGVFGIPLSDSIKYAYSTISYMDDETNEQCFGVIPTIIAKCGSYLKEEGLFVEGIFRLSGSAKRIGMLQTFFDTPPHYGSQLDWRGYTVHDAANIMRRFLNYLPDPVIPRQFYHTFRELIDDQSLPDDESLIDAFQKMIERLPLPNQFLLLYILDMLSLFAVNSKSHRMDASNLAAVFAPGILCHPDDQMSPAQYKRSQRVLEFLINHQGSLTMPSACVLLENQFIPNPARRLFTPGPAPAPPSNPIPSTSPINSIPNSPKQEHAGLPLSPFETLNVLVGPLPSSLSHSDKSQRPSTIAAESPARPARVSTMYEPTEISDLEPAASSRPSTLKRSQTLPSKRQKYGEYEPTQVVHVGRNGSQASRRMGGWKHIKRVGSERRSTDAPTSGPLLPSSTPPLPLATQQLDQEVAEPDPQPQPLAPPAQKFLWDVSLDEEDENEPKPSSTATAPSLQTQLQTISSQESLARTSVESSPDTAAPSSPRSANGFKGLNQKNSRKESGDSGQIEIYQKPSRGSSDADLPGGFKAAMRRGTIGKLLAKTNSRRSSKEDVGADEAESRKNAP